MLKTYKMMVTKTYGNKKSIIVEVEAEDKIDAMFRSLSKAAKLDWYNFKHTPHWRVNFTQL